MTGVEPAEEVASVIVALARALPNPGLQPTSGAGTTIRFETTMNAVHGSIHN
jgi:hypothetical protein